MIYEINLLPMVVLIWCCIFTQLFSRKNTDTEYWYWILILNTDTAVFFRYWYWYCFSICKIEYWYWYFSILKAYWILNTSTFILYWSILCFEVFILVMCSTQKIPSKFDCQNQFDIWINSLLCSWTRKGTQLQVQDGRVTLMGSRLVLKILVKMFYALKSLFWSCAVRKKSIQIWLQKSIWHLDQFVAL